MRHILLFLLTQLSIFAYAQEPTRQELKYKPKNLEECMSKLDLMLTEADKDTIRSMDEHDFATSQHFSLGLHMRNYWGLWGKKELFYYFDSLGVTHPDNMSGLILVSYHRYLTERKIDLEGQIHELNASIRDYEQKIEEYQNEIREQMDSYAIGDTLIIDFYLQKDMKYPQTHSVQHSQDPEDMLQRYNLTPLTTSVVNKGIDSETQQFELTLKLLNLAGNEKIRLWYPYNKSKVGDVFDLRLNGIDFSSIKNTSNKR
ncbi:DUF6794 domain-containing protein [Marinoscillum sp. MHG1-6]|uniref:DUF6794 domain-containing protein n=1 Tax=Marinoscillum sp. MHG1-6 TaxID=2959627 RepID=UPI0021573726|nr:DUF6794 domain-containing protein [Marinoscillum sp. MHG1-6]